MSKSFEEKDLLNIICEAIAIGEDNNRIIELVNELNSYDLSNGYDKDGDIILFKVIKNKNLELLKYLLNSTDINVNIIMQRGTIIIEIIYATMLAIDKDFTEGFKLLINYPDTIVNVEEHYYSLLHKISDISNPIKRKEYLEILLNRDDVNINCRYYNNPNTQLFASNAIGNTSLMKLIQCGYLECAKLILEYPYKKVDFTIRDYRDKDIIWYAINGEEPIDSIILLQNYSNSKLFDDIIDKLHIFHK